MKTPKSESWALWKVNRTPRGMEYFNNPSPFARRFWLHIQSMGKATFPAGFHMKLYNRNGFLIHFILRGEMWHRLRGRLYNVGKGQVCFMDMGEPAEYGNDTARPLHFWWAWFDGKDLSHLFRELRADRSPVFDPPDAAEMSSLFADLLTLTMRVPQAYEARSSVALHSMLAELFASRARQGNLTPLLGRYRVLTEPVRKSLDYMARFHPDGLLTLKRIADAAGQSIDHFGRVFRREMGLTPIAWLNRYRVEQARHLLAQTDKPMEHIGGLVGMPNQSYFSYLFRKLTGTPPRAYRAKALRGKR